MKLNKIKRSSVYAVLLCMLFASYFISLAANSVVMGLLITFYVFDRNISSKIKSVLNNKFVWLGILYFICHLIGFAYTDNTSFGMRQIQLTVPFLILPTIAFSEKLLKKHVRIVFSFIKIFAVLMMLFFIGFHLFIVKSDLSTIVDFTINEISSTSQLYPSALIIIAAVIAIKDVLQKKQLLLNIGIALFLTYCLLLLSSRIALIGFVVVVTYIFYRENKSLGLVKKTLFILTGMLVFGVAIYNVPRIKRKIDVFYKTTDLNMDIVLTKNSITRTKNTLEHRMIMYYTASKLFIKAPLGYGTGDYKDELIKGYKEFNFRVGTENKFNSHNQILEEFLKTGVLGGIIIILLFWQCLLMLKKNKDYVLLSCVFFIIFGCMFDALLSRQHGVLLLSFILPFLYFQTKELQEDN